MPRPKKPKFKLPNEHWIILLAAQVLSDYIKEMECDELKFDNGDGSIFIAKVKYEKGKQNANTHGKKGAAADEASQSRQEHPAL